MTTAFPGFNLANPSENIQYRALFGATRPRPIIFLSHKQEDKPSCRILAHYIKENHIDYYLDEEDPYLQIASAEKNPYKITEAIKKGISNSTHMAVVISEKTYRSEWVPFEVGYGHAAIIDKGMVKDQRVAMQKLIVIILKDLSGKVLPDYLQVGFQIKSIEDFIRYLKNIKGVPINESNLKREVMSLMLTTKYDEYSLVKILD